MWKRYRCFTKTATTSQYTGETKERHIFSLGANFLLGKTANMSRFQDIMPYVILGGIMGVFFLYVVLTVHYSANIASSQQRLASELRKIRKLHTHLEEERVAVAEPGTSNSRERGRLVDLLGTPTLSTNRSVNATS